MTFGLKRNYNINVIMSKSEILKINQMLFKEINVLMFKQNIGKNPSVFQMYLQKQRLIIILEINLIIYLSCISILCINSRFLIVVLCFEIKFQAH